MLFSGGLIWLINLKGQLSKKTEQQSILLDNMEFQVWYLKEADCYGEVNKAHAEFLGYRKDEISNQTLDKFLSAKEAAECIETNAEAFRERKEVQTEEWAENAQGEKRLLKITKTPKLNEKGETEYVISTARDITQQSKNRRLVEENKNKFETIFEQDKTMKLIIDPNNGRIVDANQAAEDFYGYSQQEITTKKIQEINQSTREDILAKMQEAKEETKNFFSFRHQTADGELKYVEVYSNPIIISEKRLLISSIHDITEKVESKEMLKESEEKFRQLAENIEEAFWMRTDDEVLYVSPAFEKNWGIERERLYEDPSSFLDYIHPDDEEYVIDELQSDAHHLSLEYRIVQADGEVRWVQDKSFPVSDKDGVSNRRVGVAEDITARKEAEKELLKTKQLYNNVINTQQEMICRFKPDTRLTFVNQAYCDYFDKSEEELLGSKYLELIPEENHEFILNKLEEIAEKKETVTYQHQVKATNGSLKWQEWTDYPIFNDEDRLIAYQSIGRDITERKERERALKEAKREAEAANQAKSEFLANMSHEIRTPLNAVIGFSELLEDMVEEREQENYLKSIKVAGENLLTLINDILDLSKIEAGELEIGYDYFDVGQLLREMKELFSQKVEEEGLNLILEIDSELPLIRLDEVRIRQILLNLIGNAVKFTDKGYIKVNLSFEKLEEGLDLFLRVEDTGIGIAKEEQEEIFNSFQQQKETVNEQYEGTGLGLAITKRLTQMMEGKIHLESEVGEGSKFELQFSGVEYKEKEEIDLITGDLAIEHNIYFEEAKVLVVDDIKSNLNLMEAILDEVSLAAVTVDSSKEAVEILGEEEFDLILLDLKMPKLSGYQILAESKQSSKNNETPVLALTASATTEEIAKIKESSFSDFMVKPLKKEDFIELLTTYLPYGVEEITNDDSTAEEIELKEDKVAELITKLEELKPQYKRLTKAFVVNEGEDFAQELLSIAEDYEYYRLINYAEQLQKFTSEFELLKAEDHLYEFEALLSDLKQEL